MNRENGELTGLPLFSLLPSIRRVPLGFTNGTGKRESDLVLDLLPYADRALRESTDVLRLSPALACPCLCCYTIQTKVSGLSGTYDIKHCRDRWGQPTTCVTTTITVP